MVHEIGHWYGAPDHYGTGNVMSTEEKIEATGDSRFNENCIFGENKNNFHVYDQFVICAGCQARIWEKVDKFMHEIS